MKISPELQQIDIVKKYFKYPQFKQQLDKILQDYHTKLNMSIYATLDQLQENKIFQIRPHLPTQKFLYIQFYGYRMPMDQQQAKKVELLWIRSMDAQLRQNQQRKYIIIYYHMLSESSYPFAFLKHVYKKLPLLYYALLEKIYVVQPNFMLKSVGIFDFGRLNKIFQRRLQFLQSYKQLDQIQILKRDKLQPKIPQQLKQIEPVRENKIKQESIGQIATIDCLTIQLKEHKMTPENIPIILINLLQKLRSKPEFLRAEGVFRKAGCWDQQQLIMKALQQNDNLDNVDATGYSIAAITKKFFTKLKVPIVPYETYNKILSADSMNEQQQIKYVAQFVKTLPQPNFRIFVHMIRFLKEQVIILQEHNKMNNYNVSAVFCPCFFRSKNPSIEDLFQSGKFAGILNVLFCNYDVIFTQLKLKT